MGPQSSEHRVMTEYALRRSPSTGSEWSDPAADGGGGVGGIVVPAFLQPLFGLDFVPYIPSPTDSKQQLSIPEHRISSYEEADQEDLVLLRTPVHTNSSNVSVANRSAATSLEDDLDDTEAELDEIDRSNERIEEMFSTGDVDASDEKQQQQVSPGKRKKFFTRSTPRTRGDNNNSNRPVRKALGKTLNVIKNGRLSSSMANNNKNSKYVGEDTERTPTRRGSASPRPKEALRSLASDLSASPPSMDHWMAIEQQVQGLKSLEEKAHSVRQRACVMEGRISNLTAEANELQRALAKVLGNIEKESSDLESTERELERLNDEFRGAAKKLSSALEKVQNGFPVPGSSFGISTPRTSSGAPTPRTSIVESEEEDACEPIDHALMIRRRSYTETDGRPSTSTSGGNVRRAESFEALPDYHTPPHPSTMTRRRANTDPQPPSTLPSSSSFMRVGDLELESSSSISSSLNVLDDALRNRLLHVGSDDFFLLDENVPLILGRLADLGLQISTDESSRFSPVMDTPRILQSKKYQQKEELPDWPFSPWQVAKGKDILVWTGAVQHKGFGHDWPVVKTRCIIRTSPRQLLDFLMDSTQLKRYNKMSQGRENVFVLQEGVDTRTEESAYGIPGDARIMRALNKPKLLPKTMEMLSLWYTKHVQDLPDAYMVVSRSVWENSTGTPKQSNRLRSEMLLGVNLLRPCAEGCELTTITHVFAPGVPEMLAKRMAPQSTANMVREIQSIFA